MPRGSAIKTDTPAAAKANSIDGGVVFDQIEDRLTADERCAEISMDEVEGPDGILRSQGLIEAHVRPHCGDHGRRGLATRQNDGGITRNPTQEQENEDRRKDEDWN